MIHYHLSTLPQPLVQASRSPTRPSPTVSARGSLHLAANPSDASQVMVLDSLASNLEDMFARQLQTMTQKLESNLQAISEQIPKQTKPIDAFNQLNEIELARRLMTVDIKGKNLEKIVNQIMSKRPFQTLPEVVEKVNGLSEKKMVEIIDTLSNLIFG